MDLFGSAPNLKCSNEAVCYNAAASPQTPFNNRGGSHLGFDYIVCTILLVDKLHHNSQSSLVLLSTKCYSAQTHWWCEAWGLSAVIFCDCHVGFIVHCCISVHTSLSHFTWWPFWFKYRNNRCLIDPGSVLVSASSSQLHFLCGIISNFGWKVLNDGKCSYNHTYIHCWRINGLKLVRY